MPPRNPYVCIAIIAALATALLIGLAGIILLAYAGRAIPESLVAVCSTAIGALSSFLVSVPRGQAGWVPAAETQRNLP